MQINSGKATVGIFGYEDRAAPMLAPILPGDLELAAVVVFLGDQTAFPERAR